MDFCSKCGNSNHLNMGKQPPHIFCEACGTWHWINPKPVAVAVIISSPSWSQTDHYLLTKRGIEPGKGKWALVGGFVDSGESPCHACTREIKEEIGLDLPNYQDQPNWVYFSPEHDTILHFYTFYIHWDQTKDALPLEETEEVMIFTAEQVRSLITAQQMAFPLHAKVLSKLIGY